MVAVSLWADYQYSNPFFLVWLAYVLIPIGDFILPVDYSKFLFSPSKTQLLVNLPESRIKAYEKDWRFLVPVYLMWLLDFGIYFGLLYFVS